MEKIHEKGYLHLDIKLDNIMIGEDMSVNLIDYGEAEKYLLADGSHRPDTGEMHSGNEHFASRHAFMNQTLSRRDDLVQVMYNLMALHNEFEPLRDFLG